MSGGLAAQMRDGAGWFGAAAPVMWDSSSLGGVTAEPAVRAATSSARAVGAGLATDGMGATSTAAAPARGARVAPVATRVTGGGQVLSLVPDAALLTSPATKFPVYIDPRLYHD